jgi:hypothetical protein
MVTGLLFVAIVIYIGAAFLMTLAGAFWMEDRKQVKRLETLRREILAAGGEL